MKTFKEASFKVDVTGLPPIFMDAKSSVEIRKNLRRQLKFPDDIENIERITKGEKIKSFKDRLKTTLKGKGMDENKTSEDMLINPKKMVKKTKFLSPQNTDKLKTDMARLKKALGPNHVMNKNNKVDELIQFAPAAMAVGAAAVRAAPAAGAAVHAAGKGIKKAYNAVKSFVKK
tara:strand:+ start:95 stop:616 length:522 start_codon:yes stop_codon:yes gene_type:complete